MRAFERRLRSKFGERLLEERDNNVNEAHMKKTDDAITVLAVLTTVCAIFSLIISNAFRQN